MAHSLAIDLGDGEHLLGGGGHEKFICGEHVLLGEVAPVNRHSEGLSQSGQRGAANALQELT
jgi:hypothetical protein